MKEIELKYKLNINLKKIILISIFLIFKISTITSNLSWGKCNENLIFDKKMKEKADLEKYLGNWYEVIRLKSTPFEKGDCIKAEYSLMEDNSIQVKNSEIFEGVENNIIGNAKVLNDNLNRLKVSFGSSWLNYIFEGDYRIMDTDFDNYSIVYGCSNLIFWKFELAWVLFRNPNKFNTELSEKYSNYLFEKFGFLKKDLYFTEKNCQLDKHKMKQNDF